jgi:plastocyanin
MKGKVFAVTIAIFVMAFLTAVILHACRNESEKPEEANQGETQKLSSVKTVQEDMRVTPAREIPTAKAVTHETTIIVDERGEFEYQNGLIRILPGDTVIWKCMRTAKGPFTVHIGWDSPFKECFFHSKNGEDIKVTLPLDAEPGYYRYMLAVLVDGIIYTDDPELIVRRPRG